jgi:hypothetical protein
MKLRWTLMGVLGWGLACGGETREVSEPNPQLLAPEPQAPAARPLRPTEWPRLRAVDLGCLFADEGAKVAPKWRCGAAATTSNEGPPFPPELYDRLPIPTAAVELTYEHGELQMASFRFAPGTDRAKARKVLLVDQPPKNVMYADLQDQGDGGFIILLQGFEHMGAGD